MHTEVDVVVVGLGPGGEHVAAEAAKGGLDVVAVDRHLVGGECPYYGCVPTKMMVRAADALAEGRRIPALAGASTVEPDWTPVAKRIAEEATDSWDDAVAVNRLTDAGVRFVRGTGRLTGPRQVEVDDQRFTARIGVVLNPGTEPAVPPVGGLAETPYWTNRDAVQVTELPASLAVLGGGAIGLELAQVFARFGVEVTVVEAAPRILFPEEPEASALLADVFAEEGIRVVTDARVGRVDFDDEGFRLTLGDGEVVADRLLVATGRRPSLHGIGLGTVGLDEAARALDTDERLRAADGLWALGDVTGKGAYTHVSMYQAAIVVRDLLDRPGPGADYRAVPRVTFTDPEVGSVGMSEQQARDAGLQVRVGRTDVAASSRGWIHREGNAGLVKLVEDADQGVLVGACVAGPGGGEVLSGLAVAVHGRVPTEQLRSMMYAYPTFFRAVETALADLGSG